MFMVYVGAAAVEVRVCATQRVRRFLLLGSRPVAYWPSMLAWRSCAPLLLPPLLSSREKNVCFLKKWSKNTHKIHIRLSLPCEPVYRLVCLAVPPWA